MSSFDEFSNFIYISKSKNKTTNEPRLSLPIVHPMQKWLGKFLVSRSVKFRVLFENLRPNFDIIVIFCHFAGIRLRKMAYNTAVTDLKQGRECVSTTLNHINLV